MGTYTVLLAFSQDYCMPANIAGSRDCVRFNGQSHKSAHLPVLLEEDFAVIHVAILHP